MNILVLASLVTVAVSYPTEEARAPPAVLLAGSGFFGSTGTEVKADTMSALAAVRNNEEASADAQEERTTLSREVQQGETIGTAIEGIFEPLNLPAGARFILGPIDTSFACGDYPYGYYADEGNYCRVFHVCVPYLFEDGHIEPTQYSFMCNKNFVFDQEKLTCVEQSKVIPCNESPKFYRRNEEFGLPEEKF